MSQTTETFHVRGITRARFLDAVFARMKEQGWTHVPGPEASTRRIRRSAASWCEETGSGTRSPMAPDSIGGWRPWHPVLNPWMPDDGDEELVFHR